jgi:patatin-like phospholipase/acyl hydrolase
MGKGQPAQELRPTRQTRGGDAASAETAPFQILTFDGGGLKGLFAAALLADVEKQLGVTIADHFDLIAGTSTGGLIAGFGAGLRPAEIVNFYLKAGPQVFGRPRRLSRVWRPKHEPEGLRAALTEVFGDRRLASSTKRLVIPAYSLDLDDVYIFKTRHHTRLTRDHTELMVDVAMATMAAPTYLPAARLRNKRLIARQGGEHVLYGSSLALAATTQTWAAHRHTGHRNR